MNLRLISIVLVMIALAGCVTSGPTDKLSPPDAEEAARLNLDLGLSYLRQGKPEEALRKLQKSIQAKADNPAAYRVQALVYEQLSDPERAEASYREAVRYGPNDQAALNDLAVFVCRQEKGYKDALQYFDRAIEVPSYQYRHEVLTNAGRCAKKFDTELAERYLRRAISLKPQFPEALFHLAEVSYDKQEFLSARGFIERCLAATAPLPDVLYLAYRIEIALGDSVAAQTYRARLLNEFPDSKQAGQLLEAERGRG
jgi:type IV pilus assembly protein PilF